MQLCSRFILNSAASERTSEGQAVFAAHGWRQRRSDWVVTATLCAAGVYSRLHCGFTCSAVELTDRLRADLLRRRRLRPATANQNGTICLLLAG